MTLGNGPHAESALIAFTKRKAQLERWKESETDMEIPEIRNRPKRVKFADKCIFQAACASNDKMQVSRMIQDGYNINTVDEDGITALHQACIEDNFEMVEFLLENGADVNIGDNEGWTPLHAVATCGYVSIARLLLEHGADIVALNNDCNLPIDICKSTEIRDLFNKDIATKKIDLGEARRGEEIKMMKDARKWLACGSYDEEPQHATGATAVHVAACKGYINVLEVLLKAGADINARDLDGWTPLHAAAHWGQEEVCRILLDNMCDVNARNNCDQTALQVADTLVIPVLEDYLSRLEAKKNMTAAKQVNFLPLPPRTKTRRLTSDDEPNRLASPQIPDSTLPPGSEIEANEADDTLTELPSDEILDNPKAISAGAHPTTQKTEEKQIDEEFAPEENVGTERSLHTSEDTESVETTGIGNTKAEPGEVSNEPHKSGITTPTPPKTSTLPTVAVLPTRKEEKKVEVTDDDIPTSRRGGSFRTTTGSRETPKLHQDEKPTDSVSVRRTKGEISSDTNLRRAYSFESDPRFYSRLTSARNRIKAIEAASAAMNATDASSLIANSTTTITRNTSSVSDTGLTGSPSNQNNLYSIISTDVTLRRRDPESARSSRPTTISTSSPQHRNTGSTTVGQIRSSGSREAENANNAMLTPNPSPPGGSKGGPVNKFKQFLIKSFIPPTRDEESETQRKAHAKRVRETRRSTQGVTLDELKSAEQYVKTQQDSTTPIVHTSVPSSTNSARHISSKVAPPLKDEGMMERRPSWRLRVDDTDRSKFSLEDTREKQSAKEDTTTPRSPSSSTRQPGAPSGRPPLPPDETEQEKRPPEEEKEKDSNLGSTSRKKNKHKRRSTGLVQYSADDSGARDDVQSDLEVGSRRSSAASSDVEHGPDSKSENGLVTRVNYRKLYEETLKENQLLKSRLTAMEEQISDLRVKLERSALTQRINPDDTDKREKRALERKLSEMEEELKESRHLKSENQKLRDENGALIRVISKLSK